MSKGTVSKFLNPTSGYYVADATRMRIEAAIAELEFQPSAIAQGLTQNRTMTIGFVAADLRNPFYPDLVAGVQEVVEKSGYTVVLGSSGSDPARERSIVQSMVRRRVDGVILGSARIEASELELLTRSGVRVVLASRNLPGLVTDTVIVDNVRGAEIAVDHLASLGHTRIGHLGGPPDVIPFHDRMTGFRAAMFRHGLKVDESVVTTGSSDPESGAAAAHAVLSRSDRPTALFVGNDSMALGAMDAANRLGLRIPEDISIVGFDDIAVAANSFISLTTIDSDAVRLGRESAELLLGRLRGDDSLPADRYVLYAFEPKLVLRSTTGSPPTS